MMVSRGSSIILKTPESITMNTKEQTVESPLVSEKDSSIDDREGGPTDDGTIDTNSDPVIVSRCSSTILKTPESITMDTNEQIVETPLVSESDSPIDDMG